MAAAVPSSEPTSLVQGDTWSWTKSLTDYSPTDGWSLSYALRMEQGAGLLNITAASSNQEFAVTVLAASSNALKPGRWLWASYVTLGAQRYQVATGHVDVTPNLATIDYSIDFRSSAKKAYDNALAAWEGVRLGQTVMLNGRTYTQHNLDALTRYVDRCRADYAKEQDAESFAQTGINPRHIKVRLTRV